MLGAKEVISFDIDPNSVKAANYLIEKFGYLIKNDQKLNIFEGSIMDDKLVESLREKGDIVYSWGVLHHTGNMWKAIENVTNIIKPNGYLIIAIYNHAPSSEFWLKVKKFYNRYPLLQPIMIMLYGSYCVLGFILKRKTLRLRRERGMHVFYDAIDWLGGLPYEFACFDEIKDFVESKGLELIKSPTKLPCGKNVKVSAFAKLRAANTGCNEFVFKKKTL